MPWWGAVLIAVTATAVGFAFDAGGGKELTNVFAGLYFVGCVAAILMVRQSAIFTAVVQPPMILFASVPGAYFLFHDGKINGLKDILINCAYPLIERFPLMVVTSGAVLLIGLIRWVVGARRSETESAPAVTEKATGGLKAKISSLLSPGDDDEEKDAAPTRRHAAGKPKAAPSSRKSAAAERTPRPRRTRPPVIDDDLPVDRPTRRSRSTRPWEDDEPVDLPRRRPSAARTTRTSYDPLLTPYEPPERAPRERRSRHDAYDPYETYEPAPRRRPRTNGAAAANGTHHPISQVRYRGSPSEPESRAERSRSRPWEADSWEYDI
ncbi:MAG: hypothetical protein QOH60_1884 [Mycobacterium sp.]|nr:hypothetical protein [Mycobacterium sp.]